ncbi:MAG TPA: hypothetical protein VFQ88_03020 [Nevskiaceae bacterium]|nr:hypothetical protein [Nevskiaceae bacterium]
MKPQDAGIVCTACVAYASDAPSDRAKGFIDACGLSLDEAEKVRKGLREALSRGRPVVAMAAVRGAADGEPVVVVEGQSARDIAGRLGEFAVKIAVGAFRDYRKTYELRYYGLHECDVEPFRTEFQTSVERSFGAAIGVAAEGSRCHVAVTNPARPEPSAFWPWIEKHASSTAADRMRDEVVRCRSEGRGWLALVAFEAPVINKAVWSSVTADTAEELAGNVVGACGALAASLGMPESVAAQIDLLAFSRGYGEVSAALASATHKVMQSARHGMALC